jgi:hypothetical protein
MRKTIYLGCLLMGGTLAAQGEHADWSAKAKATSMRFAEFVPDGVTGVGDNLPWSIGDRGTQTSASCGEAGCAGLYLPIKASRRWSFDDPALLRDSAELDRQGDALLKAFVPPSADVAEKNQAAIEKIQAQFSADAERLMAKLIDPKAPAAEKERLSAHLESLQKKMQQDQDAVMAASGGAPGLEEAANIDAKKKKLRDRARTLEFTIEANATPAWCSGELSTTPTRSGVIKGRSVYRYAASVPGPPTEHVCLAIYLGPDGFRNPPPPNDGRVSADIKTIFITARLSSTPPFAKADEAIARQLLEKIDYEGLMKLLQH